MRCGRMPIRKLLRHYKTSQVHCACSQSLTQLTNESKNSSSGRPRQLRCCVTGWSAHPACRRPTDPVDEWHQVQLDDAHRFQSAGVQPGLSGTMRERQRSRLEVQSLGVVSSERDRLSGDWVTTIVTSSMNHFRSTPNDLLELDADNKRNIVSVIGVGAGKFTIPMCLRFGLAD